MTNTTTSRRDQRIVKHIKAIHESAGNPDGFRQALHDIRLDSNLKPEQREAIYKTLAQQSFQWYIEACTGKIVRPEDLPQHFPPKP